MTAAQAIEALACIGQLGLMLAVLFRGRRSPLALPLLLLCLDLFTWSSAELAAEMTATQGWHWLDVSTSPLTTPLTVEFLLAFVGQRRSRRKLRTACWLYFGSLSLASALAFVWPAARSFAGSDLWAALHLCGAIPCCAYAIALLVKHLRQERDTAERARTRLLLIGFAIAAAFGTTELWGHFLSIPQLGPLGLLAGSTLTAAAAMRRLLDVRLSPAMMGAALAIALLGVLGYLLLIRTGDSALFIFEAACGSLALLAVAQHLGSEVARQREHTARLTSLGRFSAQLSHDLRNPLAALKGAAQFFEEQQRREAAGRPDLLNLLLEQIDRIEKVVERYQRLAQVPVALTPLAVNDVVREVLALQPFASGACTVVAELGQSLPLCRCDRELLGTAVENLVRNALEAMPSGGTITVRTEAIARVVKLSVSDEGPGMDARTRERAFDEFFTTKATGSGLGLSFVRRVAEAHGGSVALVSGPGRGTVVTVKLPAQ